MNCNNIRGNITEPVPECQVFMPGIQRLLFIPRKHVETINALAAQVPATYSEAVIIGSPLMGQQAVTVKPARKFAEIYCSDELGELKYEPQGQKGSRSLHATVEIFHPGFKAKLLGYMAWALNTEFMLLVMTSAGSWHLLGDLNRGCRLIDGTEASSGKAVTDANGGRLTFEYNCARPRVFYYGWDPDDPVNGVERFRIAYLLGVGGNGRVLGTEDGRAIGLKIFK